MDERGTRTDSGDAGLRSTALPSEPGPPPPEPDPPVGRELDRYRVEARRGARQALAIAACSAKK